MIKRTLYFGNPCYLRMRNKQLVISYPDGENENSSVPVEDIGVVVLDNQQITITQGLLAALSENNSAIINCNHRHLPFSLMLPMSGHTEFTEKIRYQIKAKDSLKNRLWKQTIEAKIINQASLLEKRNIDAKRLYRLAKKIKSGDPENMEARAAFYYWKALFKQTDTFKRERYGDPPNNLFNYGYAVLRAVVARSLAGSGLLNAIGIHHHNKYNPYCLADDVMEPFRPLADEIIMDIAEKYDDIDKLTREIKTELLQIPVIDIMVKRKKYPLMVGVQHTTASLAKCFSGTTARIIYPSFP